MLLFGILGAQRRQSRGHIILYALYRTSSRGSNACEFVHFSWRRNRGTSERRKECVFHTGACPIIQGMSPSPGAPWPHCMADRTRLPNKNLAPSERAAPNLSDTLVTIRD
jgi:hypothetical protein